VRELSEFGDTVGVLDAHHALIRRNVPFHFDVFQTMLHHFARIGDLGQCFLFLHGALGEEYKTGKVAEGKESTQESWTKTTSQVSRLPKKMLYNAMLLALIENKRWEWCDQVLVEMDKKDVHWDEATCLLVARMHLQSSHPERMKDVLKQARVRGISDLSTLYNYVLVHTTNETEKQPIQNEMKKKDILVADVSLHPLLSAEMAKPVIKITSPTIPPTITPIITPTIPPTTPPTTPPTIPPTIPPTTPTIPPTTPTIPTASSNKAEQQPKLQQQDESVLNVSKQQDLINKDEQPTSSRQEEHTVQQALDPIFEQNLNTPFPAKIPPPFPLPYPSDLYPPPYPYPNPPSPYPYPEFYNPLPPDRIILNIQSPPPPQPTIPSPPTVESPMQGMQGKPIFTTRQEYHQAIANTKSKERKQSLLRNMLLAKIMPDESTIHALISSYKMFAGCQAWSDFASVNCEQILPQLVPMLVPKTPFNWRHMVAAFKNNSIKLPLAYDEVIPSLFFLFQFTDFYFAATHANS
jgi:pentatricopeptide repeat protein